MSRLTRIFAALCAVSLGGCLARAWGSGSATLVTENQVAVALGEKVDKHEPFDPKSLVDVQPPQHVRPCCAFGMDLKVQVAGVTVPWYSQGNVLGVTELGRHEYDNGAVTLNEDITRLMTVERNGLVYTCRGGFIDTAHVRDNADLTLFLTLKIVGALPNAVIVPLPGDGATRRVVVKQMPAELFERAGRWAAAIAIAKWAAFQLSIWHEIVTYHGFESVPGFSEKVSAFSPEDLYSNLLGAGIAGSVLQDKNVTTRRQWDDLMDAWVPATLKHLGAQPIDIGRLAMKAVDGAWWDGKKTLPDWTLVKKRKMDIGRQVTPWIVSDAKGPPDAVLDAACAGLPGLLPLYLDDRLTEQAIADLAVVDFEVGDWAPEDLIPAGSTSRRLTNADFPRIVEAVKQSMEKTLGAGFDQPGPVAAPK